MSCKSIDKRLYIEVIGPTGSGKSTVINKIKEVLPDACVERRDRARGNLINLFRSFLVWACAVVRYRFIDQNFQLLSRVMCFDAALSQANRKAGVDLFCVDEGIFHIATQHGFGKKIVFDVWCELVKARLKGLSNDILPIIVVLSSSPDLRRQRLILRDNRKDKISNRNKKSYKLGHEFLTAHRLAMNITVLEFDNNTIEDLDAIVIKVESTIRHIRERMR